MSLFFILVERFIRYIGSDLRSARLIVLHGTDTVLHLVRDAIQFVLQLGEALHHEIVGVGLPRSRFCLSEDPRGRYWASYMMIPLSRVDPLFREQRFG